jgi:hypothetical protein
MPWPSLLIIFALALAFALAFALALALALAFAKYSCFCLLLSMFAFCVVNTSQCGFFMKYSARFLRIGAGLPANIR